jgi:hypothetical protein
MERDGQSNGAFDSHWTQACEGYFRRQRRASAQENISAYNDSWNTPPINYITSQKLHVCMETASVV